MQALVDGAYLREGDVPVGTIRPDTFKTMAKFLFDSGVLKGPGGAALDWPGDVSGWVDQSWIQD